jgi:hypothetical protein
MIRTACLALAAFLVGCGEESASNPRASAGAELEAAAIDAGLVPDPARASLVGSWARGGDRMCIVPGEGGRDRVGVLLVYGPGNGCVGSGTAQRDGERLDLRLGECRIEARFDGERIVFPAEVDRSCARLCAGNASLAALSVERVSASAAEAATLRAPSGRPLCAG